MKTMEKLEFGTIVEDYSGNIIQRNIMFELLVSVSEFAKFINKFEESTETVLLTRETIRLEPYYHQTIMDI